MIVVRAGPSESGRWLTESRDVAAGYRQFFGVAPTQISAVAILVDTDNTRGAPLAPKLASLRVALLPLRSSWPMAAAPMPRRPSPPPPARGSSPATADAACNSPPAPPPPAPSYSSSPTPTPSCPRRPPRSSPRSSPFRPCRSAPYASALTPPAPFSARAPGSPASAIRPSSCVAIFTNGSAASRHGHF